MDFIPGCDFNVPHSMLLDGVAECEGYGRPFGIIKCIILTNESGVDVTREICHSVNTDLVINNNGMSLGNDRVAIQIAESLLEEDVPSE
jgi:hypothetical protein